MVKAGGFIPTVNGSRAITAIRPATWNKIAQTINAGALGANGGGSGRAGANWVMVKNSSGSDRARFDCLALGDPVVALTTDGQVDLLLNAVAADPAKAAVVLVEPIANNQTGYGVLVGLVLAKVLSGSTSFRFGEADASGSAIKPVASGPIRLLGAPSASASVLLPVLLGGGGASVDVGVAKTPSGGIPARSGITLGVATCTLGETYDDGGVIKIREATPTTTALIYNSTSIATSGSAWIHWKLENGRRLIDVDDCNADGSSSGGNVINGGTP